MKLFVLAFNFVVIPNTINVTNNNPPKIFVVLFILVSSIFTIALSTITLIYIIEYHLDSKIVEYLSESLDTFEPL